MCVLPAPTAPMRILFTLLHSILSKSVLGKGANGKSTCTISMLLLIMGGQRLSIATSAALTPRRLHAATLVAIKQFAHATTLTYAQLRAATVSFAQTTSGSIYPLVRRRESMARSYTMLLTFNNIPLRWTGSDSMDNALPVPPFGTKMATKCIPLCSLANSPCRFANRNGLR